MYDVQGSGEIAQFRVQQLQGEEVLQEGVTTCQMHQAVSRGDALDVKLLNIACLQINDFAVALEAQS